MRTWLRIVSPFLLALPTALGCSHEAPPTVASPTAAPSATTGSLAVDSVPPDFAATASDGTPIQLSALKGKPVVLYFYPQDETPGCTAEACAFRDGWSALAARGVVLIGVSTDTDDSHRAFARHHRLPFLLVSDASGAIARQFGVPVTDGAAARQSVVIGANGRVKKVYRTVDVTAHAAQITADVQ